MLYKTFVDKNVKHEKESKKTKKCHQRASEANNYTVSQKNAHIFIFLITRSNINRF